MELAETKKCLCCLKDITTDVHITCSKENCNKVYHLDPLCMGGKVDSSTEALKAWVCPQCKYSTKRDTNYASTPIRSQSLTHEDKMNITHRAKKSGNAQKPQDPSVPDQTAALLGEISMLRLDIANLKGQLDSTGNTLKTCVDRLNVVTDILKETDERLKVLEERDAEISSLKTQINILQERVDAQGQASLSNEIEIAGIPERAEENLTHCVLVVAKKIGANIDEREIDWVTRVGPKQTSGKPSRTHRPVVLRMVRRSVKEDFLRQAKSRKNVTTEDLKLGDKPTPIYINERLSRENRLLFRETRLRAAKADFKYCWTKAGSIYVRKTTNAPAIKIRNTSELAEKIPLPEPEDRN
ncbi:hypothetical protein NE865_07447 [Phthorimaea operculella]|nr:hypothetical protein NE865_07447 [Phthorimaea operculella]